MDRQGKSFDPSVRVKSAAFAFSTLGELVRTKGFLGRSLREDGGLPSVGIASARRAGVPVDDNGKMRCPPGTPNANQFTDINMSNCMVPSAETAARNAAELAEKVASRTVDGFKRSSLGRKKSKERDLIPSSGVGFANPDGFIEQRRVPLGNSVVSPIDGAQISIFSQTDADEHLFNGGNLGDIPDEFILLAILGNNGDEKRFKTIGTGGGVNGMLRLEDGKTGALIGIKYQNGSDGLSTGLGSGYLEASNEALAEIVAEHMGYEPTPMRVVTSGFGGLALITELAHNRNGGTIESARISDRDSKYEYEIDTAELVRMNTLDGILGNGDRHEGNFLIGDNDGERTIIPIDHSLTFFDDKPPINIDSATKSVMAVGLQIPMYEKHADAEGFQELINEYSKIQETLRGIDIEKMRQQMLQTIDHMASFGFRSKVEERKQAVEAAIARLEMIRDSSPDSLASSVLPPYVRENIMRQRLDQEKLASQPESLADFSEWSGPV